MPRIGINDLSTELAAMICNKFLIEKSIYKITAKEISIPIGIPNFNKRLDELIVIKNSVVLNTSDYTIDERGESILPVGEPAWDASIIKPVEFNFIMLKSALPNVSAKIWRSSFTLTSKEKAVPITLAGFNAVTDQLLVVKNGTVVAHDEYEIKDNTIIAATDEGFWDATKKSPVHFEFLVFKYATPSNGIALNGYHLLSNSVELEALSPELKSMVTLFKSSILKMEFLFDAISKYGNYELKSYITANFNDPNSAVMANIDKSQSEYQKLLDKYEAIEVVSKARHAEVLTSIEKLRNLESAIKVLIDKLEP